MSLLRVKLSSVHFGSLCLLLCLAPYILIVLKHVYVDTLSFNKIHLKDSKVVIQISLDYLSPIFKENFFLRGL